MSKEPEPIELPRRLAIAVLAHAQQLAGGDLLCGSVHGADLPALRFIPGKDTGTGPVWALVGPMPDSGVPRLKADAERLLTVGLDTKGVLQLRCWEREGDTVRERQLRIRD